MKKKVFIVISIIFAFVLIVSLVVFFLSYNLSGFESDSDPSEQDISSDLQETIYSDITSIHGNKHEFVYLFDGDIYLSNMSADDKVKLTESKAINKFVYNVNENVLLTLENEDIYGYVYHERDLKRKKILGEDKKIIDFEVSPDKKKIVYSVSTQTLFEIDDEFKKTQSEDTNLVNYLYIYNFETKEDSIIEYVDYSTFIEEVDLGSSLFELYNQGLSSPVFDPSSSFVFYSYNGFRMYRIDTKDKEEILAYMDLPNFDFCFNSESIWRENYIYVFQRCWEGSSYLFLDVDDGFYLEKFQDESDMDGDGDLIDSHLQQNYYGFLNEKEILISSLGDTAYHWSGTDNVVYRYNLENASKKKLFEISKAYDFLKEGEDYDNILEHAYVYIMEGRIYVFQNLNNNLTKEKGLYMFSEIDENRFQKVSSLETLNMVDMHVRDIFFTKERDKILISLSSYLEEVNNHVYSMIVYDLDDNKLNYVIKESDDWEELEYFYAID
jgi:hypothetical protein